MLKYLLLPLYYLFELRKLGKFSYWIAMVSFWGIIICLIGFPPLGIAIIVILGLVLPFILRNEHMSEDDYITKKKIIFF